MLHELAHMEVWSHSEAFYSLLDELTHEYTELTRPLWLETQSVTPSRTRPAPRSTF